MTGPLLFSPYRLGGMTLPNRILMAPLTRNRAVGANVPHHAASRYYSQRATAGLLISEATQVSPQGVGYLRTPGLHSAVQVEKWQVVTDAVHAAGGRIFSQLWHVGRVSHPNFHGGELPVAPSANRAGLAYLHVMEPVAGRNALSAHVPRVTPHLRKAFHGTLIVNDGYDVHSAEKAPQAGDADLVAFGVPYLANPDLVERFRTGAPLNEPDVSTYYQGEERGYTDYPTLAT